MRAKKNIIVVGVAHAGPSAVQRARQANENANIVLIEKESSISFVQASPRVYLNSREFLEKSLKDNETHFQKRYNVEIRSETTAKSLDLDAKLLLLEHKGRIERMAFDSLIFAGGATNKKLDIKELDGPRVMHFRNLYDASLIRKAISEGASNAVVVGCGFYGIDAALALKEANLKVTILENKKRIMPYFSTTFSEAISAKIKEQGIELRLGCTIQDAKKKEDNSFILDLSDGNMLKADLVVVCIGISPSTSLLSEAGALLDPLGLIRVDDTMATTLPHVFACGTAVSVPQALSHRRRWFPEPAIVLRTAHIAGFNAANEDSSLWERLKPFSGTIISEVGDTVFARTGLLEPEARLAFGDDNIFVTTVFGSTSLSLKYQHEMCVKLLIAKNENKVLGGEIFGKNGVLRRIDLLGAAVLEGWGPEKLIDLDMAYLANAGPVFDPLKDAAMRAKAARQEHEGILSAENLALWLANNHDFRLVDVGETPLLSGRTNSKTLHVPLESLRERVDELMKESTPIVLYSKSGHRSYLARAALKQRGIDNVYHLDGGFAIWNLLTFKG